MLHCQGSKTLIHVSQPEKILNALLDDLWMASKYLHGSPYNRRLNLYFRQEQKVAVFRAK